MSEKQSLALELYNLAQYERSPRAKAIVLMSAVEVLADPQKQSDQACACLDRLAREAKRSLPGSQACDLGDRILNLKQQSIRSACRQLVGALLDQETAKRFGKLYDIRNKIIHRGRPKETVDLHRYASDVRKLVADLLNAVLLQGSGA